jgi:hypothetical protein
LSTKVRPIRKSLPSEEASTKTVFGKTVNGSSVSYQQRQENRVETPIKADITKMTNGTPSNKKRARESPKEPSVSSGSDDTPPFEFNSASPTVTTKFTSQRKPIVKPQAFTQSSTNKSLDGKHDIRKKFSMHLHNYVQRKHSTKPNKKRSVVSSIFFALISIALMLMYLKNVSQLSNICCCLLISCVYC